MAPRKKRQQSGGRARTKKGYGARKRGRGIDKKEAAKNVAKEVATNVAHWGIPLVALGLIGRFITQPMVKHFVGYAGG